MFSMETVASSELAQLTAVEFTRYFRHLAARVERAARAGEPEKP